MAPWGYCGVFFFLLARVSLVLLSQLPPGGLRGLGQGSAQECVQAGVGVVQAGGEWRGRDKHLPASC